MSHIPANHADSALTATGLLDEVIDIFQRGESPLFADLARMTWTPQATLAALAGSANEAQEGPRTAQAQRARPINPAPVPNGHAAS